MHSIEFLEIGERKFFPEKLGECNRAQMLDAAKLLYMFQSEEILYEEFRVHLFYSLLNLSPEHSELEDTESEKWQNIFMASEVLDSWFTKDETGKMHLVLDFIHNPVKSVKYKMHTFYGPADNFDKITYGQLEDGVGELQNFYKTKEIEFLVRLFAIFYKREFEKYGSYDMDKRVKFFSTLDIRYIWYFYLLFSSFFKYITSEAMVLVDGRELDLTILFQKPENEEETVEDEHESLGLRATSFQLAESGVFGTHKELREEEALKILVRMYDLVIRSRREEAERKKQEEKAKNNDRS